MCEGVIRAVIAAAVGATLSGCASRPQPPPPVVLAPPPPRVIYAPPAVVTVQPQAPDAPSTVILPGAPQPQPQPPPQVIAPAAPAPQPQPQQQIIVQTAPPPPPVEVRAIPPGPDYVWVNGYWTWNGAAWA